MGLTEEIFLKCQTLQITFIDAVLFYHDLLPILIIELVNARSYRLR
jgi:hypothetical protein